MKKKILVFTLSFLLLMIVSCLVLESTCDTIWNYGFSYNIANGLVPYKDFNMIVGPAYIFLIAPFIYIFGNYLIVFQIVNSVIISLIMVLIFHKIGLKFLYLILFMSLSLTFYWYNTFCAFLVILILILEDSNIKLKNILIGIIIGIIFMIKHNIGLSLFIIYFLINKNKIQAIYSILISIVPIISYLIINNAFYEYVDFCYLGMGNFIQNFRIEMPVLISLILINYLLIKKYLKYRDYKILYIVSFQIINFPLLEFSHFVCGMIPFIYYIMLLNYKLYVNILKRFICGCFIVLCIIQVFDFHITNIGFLKYNRISIEGEKYLIGMSNYIKEMQKEHTVYLFLSRAYLLRINLNQKIIFTDLINTGNFGSDVNKYINEIDNNCQNRKCLFILDREFFDNKIYSQIDLSFKDYTLENGYYLETLSSGDRVYVNYNPES